MIHHSVIFNFKPALDPAVTQNFFTAAKNLKTISGVQNFKTLRQVSTKNKYGFGLSMEFDNEQIYKEYNEHPLHVQFITDHWINFVDDFLEIDYVMLDQ